MSPTPAPAHPLRLAVDQRFHRRYPITQKIEYKLLSNLEIERCGIGRTVSVSRSGIFFEGSDPLPAGSLVEVLMDWPFLKRGKSQVKLVMRGRVTRSDGKHVAVRVSRYEFSTRATPVTGPAAEPIVPRPRGKTRKFRGRG